MHVQVRVACDGNCERLIKSVTTHSVAFASANNRITVVILGLIRANTPKVRADGGVYWTSKPTQDLSPPRASVRGGPCLKGESR